MKLAVALAVPLLGLLVITAVEVAHTARHVDRVRSQTQLARATVGPAGLIAALQNERTWAAADLIGASDQIVAQVKGYPATRDDTDQAITRFRAAARAEGPAVVSAYAPALARLDGLAAVRRKIDTSTLPRSLANTKFGNEIFTTYSDMITPFFDANTRVALAIDDTELREWTTLTTVATRQGETIANLARQTILDGVVGGGINTPAKITAEAGLARTFDRLNNELRDVPEPYASVVRARYPTELATNLSREVDTALKGRPVNLDRLLDVLRVKPEDGYIGLGQALTGRLTARADDLDRQAAARERLYVAIAVVTLLAAATLSWLVTRSITRPLRSLTRQARDVADHQLPEAVNELLETPLGDDVTVPNLPPVRVDTNDEVADVATALTTVQETALDLAIEQAVLRRNIADSFVNLGRRNQALLGRQLDFITELESSETDPDALSDLFRLDHLATRMRRNAESLLVLAGFDPPRKWTAPVRLSDVIRAALGEVEDYHRVAVRGVEPATIVGSAAADLAHLLAELVENALVFSPPDQTVDIRGRQRDDGPPAHGAYTLAVIDTGLGMPASELEAANRRLAGAESFTIAPSKYLGHYVAGNLAARHGITVHLDHSPGNGVTATITLPASLLTTAAVTSDPVTPPGGQRALRIQAGMPAPATGAGPRRAAPAPPPDRPVAPAPAPARTPAAAIAAGAPGGPPPRHPLHIPGAAARAPAPPAPARPARRDDPRGPGLPRRPIPMGPAGPAGVPTGTPPAGLWPRPGAGGPGRGASRPAPPRPDDSTLIQTLGRYGPPPGAAPGPGTAPPAPGRLAQRVRGAQLPNAGLTPLHAEDRRAGGAPGRPAGPRATPAAHASAADVQSLLTSFSAGVQKGLADSRRPGGSPPGGNGAGAYNRNGRGPAA